MIKTESYLTPMPMPERKDGSPSLENILGELMPKSVIDKAYLDTVLRLRVGWQVSGQCPDMDVLREFTTKNPGIRNRLSRQIERICNQYPIPHVSDKLIIDPNALVVHGEFRLDEILEHYVRKE